MTAETSTPTVPEVRVCCLRCEATGTRYGAWVPLVEAQDVPTDLVHRGRVVRLDRGVDLHVDAPTAVLETCGMPVDGPLTQWQLEAWQGLYEAVGAEQWPALVAWVGAGVQIEDGGGLPSASDFAERYAGQWDSFEEYVQELADETGLTTDWPETAVSYFDWSRWARDLRYDYMVCVAPHGPGVYVFRDL
ncbi:antirestriction protein ArdA [Micrococcus luteus]|uniref:antirestriction protein ArdA n=1 Tax=Micrococcus luteus TaxID=1270 RepID=UPI00100961B1|nr:antirestriction protein ArdA [Micrococcus luteus]QAV29300.1 antirestriction protein [Micrococcus luteus]